MWSFLDRLLTLVGRLIPGPKVRPDVTYARDAKGLWIARLAHQGMLFVGTGDTRRAATVAVFDLAGISE